MQRAVVIVIARQTVPRHTSFKVFAGLARRTSTEAKRYQAQAKNGQ